jgi:hypothetical protein
MRIIECDAHEYWQIYYKIEVANHPRNRRNIGRRNQGLRHCNIDATIDDSITGNTTTTADRDDE